MTTTPTRDYLLGPRDPLEAITPESWAWELVEAQKMREEEEKELFDNPE